MLTIRPRQWSMNDCERMRMTERLHRDYWSAERAVEAVDRFAIAERSRLSLPTIRRALMEARMIGEAA